MYMYHKVKYIQTGTSQTTESLHVKEVSTLTCEKLRIKTIVCYKDVSIFTMYLIIGGNWSTVDVFERQM